jgi:hypothetical protein
MKAVFTVLLGLVFNIGARTALVVRLPLPFEIPSSTALFIDPNAAPVVPPILSFAARGI